MIRRLPLFLMLMFLSMTSYAQSNYVTLLSGHQEVPSTTTIAEGLVELTLRGDSLDVSGEINGLSSPIDVSLAGGAHIHSGFIGQNGPVLLPIGITQDPDDFSAEFDEATYFVGDIPNFESLLDNGQAYVNVHTLNWAGGEVRGQLVNTTGDRVEDAFDAMMYGDQQNSPVLTDGIGGLMVVVTADNIIITGSYELESPLEAIGGTGAHLHIGYHGQNGPVALALTPTMGASALTGTFEASNNTFPIGNGLDTLVDAINERQVYVNIHSQNNPLGELRGQVVNFNNNVYFSYVSYSDPAAFPLAQSVMRVMAEKELLEDSISVSGSYSGWNANLLARPFVPFVQFLNPFVANTPGLTIFPIPDDRDATGTAGVLPRLKSFADANAQIGLFTRFLTRSGWANTTGTVVAFDNDFYHECKRAFYSYFTGSQAVPSTNYRGYNEAVTEYYTDRIEINGEIRGLSGPVDVNIAGGMHIHSGFAGQTGGIVENVSFQQSSRVVIIPSENTLFLTPAQAAEMKSGGWYYNVHTAAFPTGEARAQVLPRANVILHGIMSAGQAVPATGLSLANGGVMGELYADKVVFSGSFNDLDGGFDPNIAGGSHLHGNVSGRTGDIMETLLSGATVGATDGVFFRQNNTFPVSNSMIDSLILRVVYANIHSQANPTGELRGQIGPLANNVAHGVLSPDVTVPYTGMLGMSTGTGHIHGEVYDTTLVVTGSWTDLSSAVDTSIAGGAHLHFGTVTETGGIATPLQLLLDSVQTSAVLNPVLNRYPLPATTIAQLVAGDLYANVHTLDAGSGAIRGQLLMSENQYPDPSPLFRFPSDGMMLDLGSAAGTTIAAIDWVDGAEYDSEQDFGSFWQLYADTTMMPVFQSQVSDSSGISFTYAQIDTLLMDLGVAEGDMATVYHRSATTDGSLIVYSDLSEVTFTRRFTSGLNDLPVGSAQLVNTLTTLGGELLLDIEGLDAGTLTYQITAMNGSVLAEQELQHGGVAQRYVLPNSITNAGVYALTLNDQEGRSSSWMFVVK